MTSTGVCLWSCPLPSCCFLAMLIAFSSSACQPPWEVSRCMSWPAGLPSFSSVVGPCCPAYACPALSLPLLLLSPAMPCLAVAFLTLPCSALCCPDLPCLVLSCSGPPGSASHTASNAWCSFEGAGSARRTCADAGLQELRSWMRAELFLTNFRPVPLTEHAVFKGCVYSKVCSVSKL